MISIVLTLAVLLGTPLAALQQEGWSETSFHRIHLRNGNFIDGKLIADKTNEVVLLLRAGEMSVRRDQIDRIELVKLKSYNDKAILLDTPKATNPTGTTPPPVGVTPPPVVDTPEAIRKKVDMIMFKFKNTPGGDDKEIPYVDIASTGEEGATYLASRLPAFDDKSQAAIGVCLIQLQKVKFSEKVRDVLAGFLDSPTATVRAAAVTSLGATLDDEGKFRFLRPAMQDKDARIRLLAMSALGNVQSREWYEPVKDVCADPDPNVRNRAVLIVKDLADRHGLKENLARQMIGNTRHPDAGVRADSASVLGALGDAENWRALTSMLNDQDPAPRAAAAQSLMMLGVADAGEDIAIALGKETDRSVQVYLIGAVLKVRIRKAIEPLIRLLGQQDQEVKRLAHNALRSITGQTFEADPTAWTEWWNANR
ncbi:MAG: HEAT repeat domain-containing protein [Planctomycetaceae bacterium]|nr:HEAT repeat domain-containing protein [Planctomycetaceae bacterium]